MGWGVGAFLLSEGIRGVVVPAGASGVGGVGGVWECGGISDVPRVTCCTWIDPERIFPAVFSQSCACPTPFALENPRINAIPQEIRWKRERASTDGLLRGAWMGCRGQRRALPASRPTPSIPHCSTLPRDTPTRSFFPNFHFLNGFRPGMASGMSAQGKSGSF